jgi:hypothetical protein
MALPDPSSGEQSPNLSTAPTAIETIQSTTSGECSVCTKVCESDQCIHVDYRDKPCHGWPRLVDVMVERPGFQCFPAFRDLNIKSLLYYQAELDKFREELFDLEWEDHENVNARISSNVDLLLRTEQQGGNQIKTVKKMREVLREYSKTFIQMPLPKHTR